MRFVTDTADISFNDYEILFNTTNYEALPTKRVKRESVIGRNGQLTFDDGYSNKLIQAELSQPYQTRTGRKMTMRDVIPELAKLGKLFLAYEDDIYWYGRVIDGASTNIEFAINRTAVVFEVNPLAYSALEEDLTWGEADVSWGAADFDWGGSSLTETFGVGTHTVVNRGNHISQPSYIINGAGSITINGETFTATEACIVDVENKIVYNSGANKMSAFTGDFEVLAVGDNTLVTDVQVKVAYKDRWI